MVGGVNHGGTVFKISPKGALRKLHNFHLSDGVNPSAGLVQATDGNFYGTITTGGAIGYGTIFKITPGGTLTTLHSFGIADGEFPQAGLVQATDGTFYGTTHDGGAIGYGTVFRLSVGLGPFVETRPVYGKVGATVTILGDNLMGSTAVTFNGAAAAFTVVSDTEITTTVPSDATTGKIEVLTPSAALISNANFHVR